MDKKTISAVMSHLGRKTSEAKKNSSAENGKKGGRPLRWCVYVAYDGPHGTKGDVLSRHATYEAAERAERKYSGGFTGIKEV